MSSFGNILDVDEEDLDVSLAHLAKPKTAIRRGIGGAGPNTPRLSGVVPLRQATVQHGWPDLSTVANDEASWKSRRPSKKHKGKAVKKKVCSLIH